MFLFSRYVLFMAFNKEREREQNDYIYNKQLLYDLHFISLSLICIMYINGVVLILKPNERTIQNLSQRRRTNYTNHLKNKEKIRKSDNLNGEVIKTILLQCLRGGNYQMVGKVRILRGVEYHHRGAC